MNLEKLTEKEIRSLRRIGWVYQDIIADVMYDNKYSALQEDNSVARLAFYGALDLCRACSAELEKRGVEE